MPWLDIGVLVIGVIILLRGVSVGVAVGLLDIVIMVVTLQLTRTSLFTFIAPFVGSLPVTAELIIFLVLWIPLYISIVLASKLLFKLVKIQFLAPLEQIGGLLMGAAKIILLLVIIMTLVYPLPGGAALLDDAYSVRIARFFTPWITFLPKPILPSLKLSPEKPAEKPALGVDALQKAIQKQLPTESLPKELQEALKKLPNKL